MVMAPRARISGTEHRLRFLEGMRGLAALYVVLGHLCSMVDPASLMGRRDDSPAWIQGFCSLFAYGHVAVAIFIVISGFSLQLSLFANGSGVLTDRRRFYLRRAQRILPTYYACLAISILIAFTVTPLLEQRYGAPFGMYLPVTRQAIWSHVLLIHNWSPGWMYKINGVLWSIGIESQLYLLFPILAFILTRTGRFFLVSLCSVLAVVCLLAFPHSIKLYPWYLPLFALGMASAHFAYRPHLRSGVLPGPALTAAALAAVGGIVAIRGGSDLPVVDAAFGFSAAALMYAMTVNPTCRPAKALSWRALTFLGGFSYSMYLMHHPMAQLFYRFKPDSWGEGMSLAFQFALGLPFIVLTTWLFSLAFERPFLPRKNRRELDRTSNGLTRLPLRTTAVASTTPSRPVAQADRAMVRER